MSADLYYTPTSCGAASFISAYKAGLIASGKVTAAEVDLATHTVKTGPKKGTDFYTINPKGNVASLIVDGAVLNENAAVLQYIADQSPESKLAPANGTIDRYLLQAKLSLVSSEVHKAYAPFFRGPSDAEKVALYKALEDKLQYVNDKELSDSRKYLIGDDFTVADAYLYIVAGWSGFVGVDLSKFPRLAAYHKAISELDFVKEAHAAMAAASKTA